jgi:ATP-dependent helicase/nuclease subunit A
LLFQELDLTQTPTVTLVDDLLQRLIADHTWSS